MPLTWTGLTKSLPDCQAIRAGRFRSGLPCLETVRDFIVPSGCLSTCRGLCITGQYSNVASTFTLPTIFVEEEVFVPARPFL